MDRHALQFLKNLLQAENKGYNFKDFVFGTSLNSTDNNFKLKILRNLSSKYGIYAVKKGNLDFLDPLTSIDIGIDPLPVSARYYKAYPPGQDVMRPKRKKERDQLFAQLGFTVKDSEELMDLYPIEQTDNMQFFVQNLVNNMPLFSEMPELAPYLHNLQQKHFSYPI